MMTAACVSTNYLLVGVVNVKFMDLIVFISGLAFGPLVGLSVGTLTWLVYGTLNPYGFSLPILVATCIGESIYGLVGGLLNKVKFIEDSQANRSSILFNGVKFAIIGFLLTFIYDMFTNIIFAISVGMPLFLVLTGGIPFALVHEASNVVIFFVGAMPLLNVINRLPHETPITTMVKS
jgi:hypothetical protein